jgi:hypothetical protein
LNINSKQDKECGRGDDIILLSEIITNSRYGKKSVVGTSSNLRIILERKLNLISELWSVLRPDLIYVCMN